MCFFTTAAESEGVNPDAHHLFPHTHTRTHAHTQQEKANIQIQSSLIPYILTDGLDGENIHVLSMHTHPMSLTKLEI